MFKKISLLMAVIISLYSVNVFANSELKIDAKAALLMEPLTGKVLYEHNAHEKLPPASVTKVMTMLLIYEAVDSGKIKWTDSVSVSEHAASMGGSQIFLEPGEQQSVADMTKSIVVASANDAAVAMAEFISGSETAFVADMNRRAQELGMNDTRFVNACGLDTPGHLTSAYDIALMTREMVTKHSKVFEYSTIWMDTITHKTRRGDEPFGLTNTNKLIKYYSGATGLKTGSTSEALYCISATAQRDGMQMISVIMGAPNPSTRFGEAGRLMDYGFANYAVCSSEPAGTVKGKVRVLKGEKEEVDAVIKDQISVLITKGKNVELEAAVMLDDTISAPFSPNTKIGEIVYSFDGSEVGRSDLITAESVNKAGFPTILDRVMQKWFD